jgi:hypothetical protein
VKIPSRGQIEVSFNWIFVLIAGAAILFITITIARNIEKNSDKNSADIVSQRIQMLLSALEQNPGGVQIHDILKQKLTFSCGEEEGYYYEVKGSDRKIYLSNEKLFAPKTVGDNAVTIAWTREFDAPYPVSQILYFSDEKTFYLFESSARDFYRNFPEQFSSNLSTAEQIEDLRDQGFRKYIIVTRSDGPELNLHSSIEHKSTIVRIGESKIKFIYNGDNQNAVDVPYLDEDTAYGAIITGDHELYGCAMQNIMKASRIVGEINLERAKIIGEARISSMCKKYFEPPIPTIEELENIILLSVYPPPNMDYSSPQRSNLRESISMIYQINEDMKGSCPSLY